MSILVVFGLSMSFLANDPGAVLVEKMILFFSSSAHSMNKSLANPDVKSCMLANTTCNITRKFRESILQSENAMFVDCYSGFIFSYPHGKSWKMSRSIEC